MLSAYNNYVKTILISDAGANNARTAYIYNALSSYLPPQSPPEILTDDNRTAIAVEENFIGEEFLRYTRNILTEVVAIGYKYAYLSKKLPLEKLTFRERKIFLCALICADLPADKKYIRARLSETYTCALDGFFSFRMPALKKKWEKIISYIPPDFSVEELERFMGYLVEGNKGKVFVRGGEVYDSKYRLCRRSQLVGAPEDMRLETEILLSGAGEVHIFHPAFENSTRFLRKYYAAHTVFYGNS